MAANAQLAGSPTTADVTFMRMAIEEARLADFPFGAVIVRDGAVMARGRNLGRTNQDPTAHGEMDAIRKCLAEHGPAALRGSTLYTSGEPCAMCMGAILWCHVERLVFAASVTQLATKIDQISCRAPRSRPRRHLLQSRSPAACWQTRRWRCSSSADPCPRAKNVAPI
jgi:tRNA(Arg) A34 adenosine deaminase TadA